MEQVKAKYLWLDIETTGLDPRMDQVLEVAAIVTDENLNELGRWQGLGSLSDQGLSRLRANEFVRNMHAAWIGETIGRPLVPWDAGLLLLIREHEWDGKPILAGASVHFDRSFMPKMITELLHHRMLDVSALKMFRELRNLVPKAEVRHRAMADIEYTLSEARAIQARLREVPEAVRIPTLAEARAICRNAGDFIETHDDYVNSIS